MVDTLWAGKHNKNHTPTFAHVYTHSPLSLYSYTIHERLLSFDLSGLSTRPFGRHMSRRNDPIVPHTRPVSLNVGLTDSHAKCPMGVTAENLAEEFGISRADSDAYALQSQARWADAHAKGRYDDEISPIELTSRKGSESFSVDEHPRMTPPEKMASLPTTFKKGGVVTAASASGICDGAASLVVASAEAAAEHGLQPIADVKPPAAPFPHMWRPHFSHMSESTFFF